MDSFYSAVDFAECAPTIASKEKAVAALNSRLPAFDYDALSFGVRSAPLAAKETLSKAIPMSVSEKREKVSITRIVSSSSSAALSPSPAVSVPHTINKNSNNNGNNKHEKLSPCRERPGYLTRFHAYAQERDFERVRVLLDAAVRAMDSEHLDGEFDCDECMWRMKYFHGADMRELHLCVYWDSRRDDHCFELLRVYDSGHPHCDSPSTHDFFAHFRSALAPAAHNAPAQPLVAKRSRCLPPPPLVLVSSQEKETVRVVGVDAALPPPPARLSRASTADNGLPLKGISLVPPPPPTLTRAQTAVLSPPSSSSSSAVSPFPAVPAWALPITAEEHLAGVRQLTSLLADTHYETRCECARALCVLAQKLAHSPAQGDSVERELLLLPECVEEIVCALCELLCDEWEEVCELAVMAVSLFSEREEYMAVLGSQPKVVEKLLDLTLELASSRSYKTAMSRRRAALSLSRLVQHDEARLSVSVDECT